MITAPPAIVVLPLATKDQMRSTLSYVLSRLRQAGAQVERRHSDEPLYVECRVSRDGLVQRLDVYVTASDYANVLPAREEIKEGVVERTAYVHLLQGVAVRYDYNLSGGPRLERVVIYTVGAAYRDLGLNI